MEVVLAEIKWERLSPLLDPHLIAYLIAAACVGIFTLVLVLRRDK